MIDAGGLLVVGVSGLVPHRRRARAARRPGAVRRHPLRPQRRGAGPARRAGGRDPPGDARHAALRRRRGGAGGSAAAGGGGGAAGGASWRRHRRRWRCGPAAGSATPSAPSTSTSPSRRWSTSTAASPATPSTAGRWVAGPAPSAARARAFLAGLHGAGAGGCVKHFPGLGGAAEDTHFEGSRVALARDELERDLAPFRALAATAGAVMLAHAAYPAFDPSSRPASLSAAIAGRLLRDDLGFTGVAFSDDLEMHALDRWGGLPERAEATLAAGCDALLVCSRLAEAPEVAARLASRRLGSRRRQALARLAGYREHLKALRAGGRQVPPRHRPPATRGAQRNLLMSQRSDTRQTVRLREDGGSGSRGRGRAPAGRAPAPRAAAKLDEHGAGTRRAGSLRSRGAPTRPLPHERLRARRPPHLGRRPRRPAGGRAPRSGAAPARPSGRGSR